MKTAMAYYDPRYSAANVFDPDGYSLEATANRLRKPMILPWARLWQAALVERNQLSACGPAFN
jgi:hypothetical protein